MYKSRVTNNARSMSRNTLRASRMIKSVSWDREQRNNLGPAGFPFLHFINKLMIRDSEIGSNLGFIKTYFYFFHLFIALYLLTTKYGLYPFSFSAID